MLKITEYADKLLEGLDHVDYIERVKVSQKNWIGRSTGAEVDFPISRQGRQAAYLHDTSGYSVRCNLYGNFPGAPL